MKTLASIWIAILASLAMASGVEMFRLKAKLSEEQMKQKDMFNDDSMETHVKHIAKDSKKIAPNSKVDYIGQVGGLDTDQSGNLIVFHRASRTWGPTSFIGNKFNTLWFKAITENVVDVINPHTLENLGSWGKGRFYMPHGVTLDFDGNLWLTDVATHQVFKYNLEKSDEPLLSLGVRFEDGIDENHFCKPTAVAVSSITSDVFVADGYCNQRIVQFDRNGQYIKEFVDKKQPIIIAHGIALIEGDNLICTVSREDGRIVCFDIASGEKTHEIKHADMKTVYAVEYDSINEVIHAVTGDEQAAGFTFNAKSAQFGEFISTWTNKGLTHAHDIAISPDSSRIYVGQLNGNIDAFRFV